MAQGTSFASMYDRDSTTGTFVISTQVDEYAELFNYLDPAPFRRRDLSQEFLNYVTECAEDIPLRHHIALRIMLPSSARDTEKEERVRRGIKTYYSHWVLSERRKIRESYRNSLMYLGVGIIFLLPVTVFSDWSGSLATLASEGLYVGGWVFLWEAFAEFAFKSGELRKRHRRIKRTADAELKFVSI
jgi:hypothetical protein